MTMIPKRYEKEATILVVDDTRFMRLLLTDILRKNGFENIYEASNGLEAIELYKRHRPDLVTMDIIMPEMDGLMALEKILSIDRDAKVVVISALNQRDLIIRALKIGAKDFITKPFRPETVAAIVRRILGESHSAS